MTKTKLKLCPFCKGDAPGIQEYGRWDFVHCVCGGNSKETVGQAAAIENWNSRPLEDALQTKLNAMTKERDALKAAKEATCSWAWDENCGSWDENCGSWDTECGLSWIFPSGTPQENDMSYCPGCGKKVEFVSEPEEGEA